MNNILQEYYFRRTPENTELYNAYRRGEVDLFGNPVGTPLAESAANPNLTDTSVIPTTPTTTTSVDTTTDSQSPSTDDSGIGMLAGEQDLSNVIPAEMEAIDDTTSYKDRYDKLKIELTNQMDALKLNGFTYVNPGDLDYIIDYQADVFAKAGVDSILDIGKKSVKTSSEDVVVEKTTDPNGNVIY